ncbi:MAG: iron ABC transporter permease [candidate division WOR-3 bacterium]|nr:iron ABC transporter permease [candidate division WOR-3 bacterium]MCX7837616.1 iron ABC transporter permease [candidate division WOR-3 bacterium]MDW8114030.1 iron ABC transporter permease [candidate division WOR-3 bacterium]
MKSNKIRIFLLFLGLIFFIIFSLFFGADGFSFDKTIVLKIRLPRIILGFLAGGNLAFAGAILQGILENPLCDPYILGIASGAAFGVSLGYLTKKLSYFFSPIFAFLGSILTIFLVYNLAFYKGKTNKIAIILAGVIISFLFSSITMLFMVFSQRPLNEIIYLIMGNLAIIFDKSTLIIFIITNLISVIFLIIIYGKAFELNCFSLGTEVAESLGVNYHKSLRLFFFLTSFIIATQVSFAGAISFVGLIIPHITRFLFGVNYKKVLPFSFLLGALVVIIADLFARTIAPVELPISMITTFFGAPFFLYLLKKNL